MEQYWPARTQYCLLPLKTIKLGCVGSLTWIIHLFFIPAATKIHQKEIIYPWDSDPVYLPQCHIYLTKKKMVARMEQYWPVHPQYCLILIKIHQTGVWTSIHIVQLTNILYLCNNKKPSNAKKEFLYPRDSNPLFTPQCHSFTTKKKMVAPMESNCLGHPQ